MTPPAVTIITVCKNIAATIGVTCESVAGQNFKDYEWVVIDGASDDGTLAVLEKYRSRCAALVSEPDRGAFHAMNKGIERARGEYLLFLNGGDYLVSNAVLETVFIHGQSADIVYGDELFLHPEDGFLEKRNSPPAEEMNKIFFTHSVLNHQAMFIKKELFTRFGGYDERYALAADWERWVVFAKNGCTFAKVNIPVSVFCLDGMSSLSRGMVKKDIRRIQNAHFSPGELREGLLVHKRFVGYRRIWQWGRIGAFSLFSIEETPDNGRKRKYRIVNVPILTIRRKGNIEKYYLFGIFNIWKIQEGVQLSVKNETAKNF